MENESEKIVIDNNSLVNFFDHYYFDRDYNNEIYKKLRDFLLGKIKTKEIIIIDRVFDEFTTIKNQVEIKALKEFIKPYVIKTLDLTDSVQDLINNNYVPANETYIRDSHNNIDYNQISRMLDRYLNKFADLYLVAFCKIHSNSILMTDESFKKDRKLIEKLPTICNKEKIQFIDLPNALFNHYKDELNFKLN